MRTDTHALGGALIAQGLYTSNGHHLIAPLLCLAGSVLPDLVMIPLWFLDKARGKDPLRKMPAWAREIVEIGHSLPLWTALLAITYFSRGEVAGSYWFALVLGVLSHNVVDVFTHNRPLYRATDQTLLWPLLHFDGLEDVKLGGFLKDKFGIGWDGRPNWGDISLRTPEKVVSVVLCALNFAVLFRIIFPLG